MMNSWLNSLPSFNGWIPTKVNTGSDDEFGISDKEKEQLLASIQEVSNEVQDYSDKIISDRDK